jgi:hypothetical protein
MEKEIQGKIQKITAPASKTFAKRTGGTFTIWSIGINVNGEWHNIKADSEGSAKQFLFSTKLNRQFNVGDEVRIYLQAEDEQGKYWKIKAIVPYSPTDDVPVEEIEDAPEKEQGTLTQEGILTTVAKTGGIKIDNGDWINPSPPVRVQLANPADLDALKAQQGNKVSVTLNNKDATHYDKVKTLTEMHTETKAKDNPSYKAMAVSYAKDCYIASKITKDEIIPMAQKLYEYIWGE